MRSKVSVIIPVYNTERYIRDAVESILRGSMQDVEILLVDDGSADGSLDVCRSLAEQDPRIRVIPRENGGVSSARNAGMEQAEGEYIFFLDSDDLIAEDCLQRLADLADANGLDWAAAHFAMLWEGNDPSAAQAIVHRAFPDECLLEPASSEEDRQRLCRAVFIGEENWGLWSSCGALYRRELLQEAKLRMPEGITYGEDMCFNYLAAHQVRRFGYLPDPLYVVRERPDSAQGTMKAKDPVAPVMRLIEQLDRQRADCGEEWSATALRWVYLKVFGIFRESIFMMEDPKARQRYYREFQEGTSCRPAGRVWKQVCAKHLPTGWDSRRWMHIVFLRMVKAEKFEQIDRLWSILGKLIMRKR